MDRWPHQLEAVRRIAEAIDAGERRICETTPTGGGKSVIMCDLIDLFAESGKKVVVYTNRKMLIEQLSRVLDKQGIDHGIRAAGYDAEHWPVQIASMQTDVSRVLKRKKAELHNADLCIVDEAHLQCTGKSREILDAYVARGASVVGFTATPLDLGDTFSHLVQAGTTSELRDCGALVMAQHFGPDEPSLKLPPGTDPTEKQAIKAMMTPGLFGRVIEHFNILNPTRRPTILFAPGVKESIWFAQQFVNAGVTAAHIDGEEIWCDGRFKPSDAEARSDLLSRSQSGDLQVLCNRFVLREGIDAPWLSHGILATVFGSLQSYLQAGGRLLRSHHSLDHVTIQDHGGHWHRLGSLNEDRQWELGDTNHIIAARRIERLRQKAEREPQRCPKCFRIVRSRVCLCGQEMPREAARPVIQSDGRLKMMKGDIYKPRRAAQDCDYNRKHWERCYWCAYHSKNKMTFSQAEALFAMERNWGYPDRGWPKMPRELADFFRSVREVPADRLR